ncbi:biotin--[acetyl-CoA-carboxylase] ligase [Nostoc sp. CMAA1605]|uniref:biotin--[acetyl-CoA-carboxylase] ligase n=1 Tax=Nostoc sp. CMAA1605 TaxID=2055159 RepID=UPI001F328274|nr:biotin--[acetyl-CoA-carboxylase] ligase [Nostoc sp. CMAA1605]MCF4967267.1 biotin--[acetyl-CoA-carboxylase] ligase [Nostoc sp. CMAA1605]
MAVKLDQQKILTALTTERKYGYLPFTLHIYDCVTSTNLTLWELISQGATAGNVVIATQQTAGKGQWGRQWISQTGGLYLSVAINPHIAANASYQLTLATAWGITYQLRQCGINVGIKWPNDLVLERRKLGGILTETKVNQGQITQAIVGVGINWSNPVPETGINLQSWLREAGEAGGRGAGRVGEEKYNAQCPMPNAQCPMPDIETLICQVLLGIESGVVCLLEEGINILVSRYLEFLVNMGDRVYVNDLAGNVVGVTPQGSLRVSLERGCITDMKTPEIHLEPGRISLGYRSS